MSRESTEFMQLTISSLGLLLPIDRILSLESGMDINYAMPPDNGFAAGTIVLQNRTLPVYYVNEMLEPVQVPEEGSRICVCMGDELSAFAIVCDQVRKLPASAIHELPLPQCMKQDESPVTGLAVNGSQILCITDVTKLQKYLQTQASIKSSEV